MKNNQSHSLTQDWYFGCHACGKCCTSPPSLTFNEIEKYADIFNLRLAFQTVPMKKTKIYGFPWGTEEITNKQAVKIRENQKRLWPAIKNGDGITSIQIFPIAYMPQEPRKCPKLRNDGLCSIHDHRPDMCKTVPLAPALTEFLQGRIIQGFEEKGCASSIPKEGFDHIFNGHKIMPSEYKRNWDTIRRNMISDEETQLWILTLIERGYIHLPEIEQILDETTQIISVSIAGAILAMSLRNMSQDKAIYILERQINYKENDLANYKNRIDIEYINSDIESCRHTIEIIKKS